MYDTDVSSPSTAGTTVVWMAENGEIRATSESLSQCKAFDALPDAVGHAFSNGQHVIIREGTYQYESEIYLPSETHIHFENATLEPSGCHGLHLGDGNHNHVFNHVTGTVEIDPDEGSEPAETCVLIDGGTKLMSWTARTDLRGGAADSCLRIEGAEEGTWWNDLSHLRVSGRTVKDSHGKTPANDYRFSQCTFTGNIDVVSGNSFSARNCAFETCTLNLQAEADLHGRFEEVDINVDAKTPVSIDPIRWQKCTLNDSDPSFVTFDGNGAVEQYRGEDRDNAAMQRLHQHGAYTVDDVALLELVNSYSSSGQNNLLRAVASGRKDGYFLQGVDNDDSVDKEIEVHGDYVNATPGGGVVLTSPNGTQFRVTVNNDGLPDIMEVDDSE